ncbi:hypothetical protein [Roseobacter sp. HKCCA0434]|uniref:hypothetical protein n=1 Tax=Roseobacter sp. HKCCA0434 TaxID=3079297 RepID=UPI0029059B89|nr:hypothetical protein [Roseobacter sp. HKCCA0434]
MTDRPRIALAFGAFSCEMEGVTDPLPTLRKLVAFCEEVEARNPEFGQRIAPLAELNAALQTEGPVSASVDGGRLKLTVPVEEPRQIAPDGPTEPEPEIDLDALRETSSDLPDDAISSALDRAMRESARAAQEEAAPRPVLSLRDYASARRPRRIQDSLEIAAAYSHHMRGEETFDGVRLLSEVDEIDIGREVTMDEKIEAFGQMLERGTFKPTEADNLFTLARAVVLRYR